MRSVRCDACGRKALLAASSCPHCGHLFELRNSFGELLPLAHCVACDSYYPRKRGECRWCGTRPEGLRFVPYVWKGAGFLAFGAMAWGAWLVRRDDAGEAAGVVAVAESTLTQAAADSSETSLVASGGETLLDSAPTAVAVDSVSGADASATPSPLAANSPSDTAAGQTSAGVNPTIAAAGGPAGGAALPSGASSGVAASPSTPAASKAAKRPARKARWVSAVARRWVTVRADASSKARIVASVGPDTRVQLGEARGSWVRIRARGLSGWVEQRHFPSRAGRAR